MPSSDRDGRFLSALMSLFALLLELRLDFLVFVTYVHTDSRALFFKIA